MTYLAKGQFRRKSRLEGGTIPAIKLFSVLTV
jgi:hypothetical protein